MKFIWLNCTAQREGEYFVAHCRELGVSSFGETKDEAFDNLNEATLLFLNTLEDLGESDKVLAEKGVQVYELDDSIVSRPIDPPLQGETARSMMVPLPAAAVA